MVNLNQKFLEKPQLDALSLKIAEKFEDLCECLEIEVVKYNRFYQGVCPIHSGADNPSAFKFYSDGTPNWQCNSHSCHEIFKKSPIGLIRGILSKKNYGWEQPGDKIAGFREAIEFVQKCLQEDFSDLQIDYEKLERDNFVNNARILYGEKPTYGMKIPLQQAFSGWSAPPTYLINRGFSAKILSKYSVGHCLNPRDTLNYNRVVVPFVDNTGTYVVGTSSRSIFEKCPRCKFYHPAGGNCPRPYDCNKFLKWRHSPNFPKSSYLYNYNFARTNIRKEKVAILVESPGSIWKLAEAGIYTGLACLGTSFSETQRRLLDASGALTVILAMDNDMLDQHGRQMEKSSNPGQNFAALLDKNLQNAYKVYNWVPPKNDLGCMGVSEILGGLGKLYRQCLKEWM